MLSCLEGGDCSVGMLVGRQRQHDSIHVVAREKRLVIRHGMGVWNQPAGCMPAARIRLGDSRKANSPHVGEDLQMH